MRSEEQNNESSSEQDSESVSEHDSADDQDMEIYRDDLKAKMFKERGNHNFKIGDYDEAINSYTVAIEADRGNPALYGNRAMAFLKNAETHRSKLPKNDPLPELVLKYYRAADQDCSQALRCDKDFVKAYYRRGLARKGLGMIQEAVFDFEAVLRLEPKNTVAEKELQALRTELAAKGKTQKRFFSEFRSIPVEPIATDGSDWVGELKRIRIDEKNVPVLPKQQDQQVPEKMEVEFEVKVPPPAKTSFQFYADWRHLERFPEKQLQYLLSVGPPGVEKLFKDSLEVDVFTDFITILHKAFKTGNDAMKEEVLDMMEVLPSVGRFDTIRMFIEPKENLKIREIIALDIKLGALWTGLPRL